MPPSSGASQAVFVNNGVSVTVNREFYDLVKTKLCSITLSQIIHGNVVPTSQ